MKYQPPRKGQPPVGSTVRLARASFDKRDRRDIGAQGILKGYGDSTGLAHVDNVTGGHEHTSAELLVNYEDLDVIPSTSTDEVSDG